MNVCAAPMSILLAVSSSPVQVRAVWQRIALR